MLEDREATPSRPSDDDEILVTEALTRQEETVLLAGAPTAALILSAVRRDIATGGRLSDVLPDRVRFGDMVGLRVMATVHRLALDRQAPGVALYLPTLGGTPPTGAFVAQFQDAVVAALADHPAETLRGLRQTPQTNESGRAALLRIALSHLGPGMPVHLHEIGASAGLNLRADHLPGLPALEAGPLPVLTQRSGCDLDPIDATTTEGRTTLSSYVWVDDVARFERLRHALQVADDVPATVVRQDAATYVEGITLTSGAVTVLWHSAMWLYLPRDTKERILRALDALGVRARPDRRLAHVSWEWVPEADDVSAPFELVLRTWLGGPDDGIPHLLARGHSHGGDVVSTGGTGLEAEPLITQSRGVDSQGDRERPRRSEDV